MPRVVRTGYDTDDRKFKEYADHTKQEVSDGFKKGRNKGRKEGRQEGHNQMIQAMYEGGIPFDQIAAVSGLNEGAIKKIIQGKEKI